MGDWSDAFSTTPELAATLGDEGLVRGVMRFESALARALAEAGLATEEQAETIARACEALSLDPPRPFAEGATAGTLAIPLVKSLTRRVREIDPASAAWVHYGATSQDALDTAMSLQMRDAVASILRDLTALGDALARLAEDNRRAPMLGRTLLQPATPIPFGLKAAQWLASVAEAARRLRREAQDCLKLQFGGAAGSLGSLGDKAAPVAQALARLLAPADAPSAAGLVLPWHARRGGLAGLGAAFAIAIGACAKIARDVSLMMQFEVSEAMEPPSEGRGGSSAMPHKRNPVLCMFTLSAALRAPNLAATLMAGLPQEHERALGGWQAEWAVAPELAKLAGGAVANMRELAEGLIVDARRMRTNLDALRGLTNTEAASLALAQSLGREEAAKLVERAASRATANRTSLAVALAEEPAIAGRIDKSTLERLTAPELMEGASQTFIDLALEDWARGGADLEAAEAVRPPPL